MGTDAFQEADITGITLPITKHNYVVREVEGISFTFFRSQDVVRHALVGRILDAYEAFESPPA